MTSSQAAISAAGILLMVRPGPGEHGPTQFLLMRHADRWDLPKGHAEPGESPVQTAVRETEEETGITADQLRLDPSFEFSITYPVHLRRFGDLPVQKTVRLFLGFVDRPPAVRCTEHAGYRWFDWPPAGPIQAQTIDPLLAAVASHLANDHPNLGQPQQREQAPS
jgi:bis(5'-nucleosidyl)-tetraphosphatase